MSLGIVLTTTTLLRITTTTTDVLHYAASYGDDAASSITIDAVAPGSISSATTTTIVGSPGAGKRIVKSITLRNASSSATVTTSIDLYDGSTARPLCPCRLGPGEALQYEAGTGWRVLMASGDPRPGVGTARAGRPFMVQKSCTVPEAAGYWYSTSKDAGIPGPWAPGAPGVNGRVTDGTTTTDAGCIPWANATSGYVTSLDLLSGSNSIAGGAMLVDVVWVNSGLVVTTTTAQAITTPTLPARDVNGSTNGEGFGIALLFVAASTNAGAISNATVNYTDSDGNARVATLSAVIPTVIPATPVIGTVVPFLQPAGSRGVRSIQSITLGTSLATGTISLLIYREVAAVPFSAVNTGTLAIGGQSNAVGPRCYDGSCLLLWLSLNAATASGPQIRGAVVERVQ